MMMDRKPMDLRPLDPTQDELRWERLVRAISARAAPELARRSAGNVGLLTMLGRWAWPTMAAASVMAVFAGGVLARAHSIQPDTSGRPVLESLQLSAPISTWLGEERSPTATDLVMALEGEDW
jgi:hypothetical protein